jgi:hypothetical protein
MLLSFMFESKGGFAPAAPERQRGESLNSPCFYSKRQKKVVIARNPALRGMTKQSPEIASLRSQ